MRRSGSNDAVEEIARHNNHVYVPDVHDGPLMQWVLQSGLTQEEAALIQPAYAPSCLPFADLNLDGVVDWSDAQVLDLSGWDFRGMDLTGAFDRTSPHTWPCPYNLSGANLCGQCVSYVKTVCPVLPRTADWKKGAQVRGNKDILPGTVIATFNAQDKYEGHAAIYESQDDKGMTVYDQWFTGTGKAIGSRFIKWDGNGIANRGDGYYVID